MIVYRIGRTKFANDLTGEGARLHGGRWNHKLTACVYTSESRALALLEYTVNVNIDDIPRALSFTAIEIPDDDMLPLGLADLPGNWNAAPAPTNTKQFGTVILKKNQHLVVKIPSAVIPAEFNYLINPLHSNIVRCKILSVSDFVYDVRIKTV